VAAKTVWMGRVFCFFVGITQCGAVETISLPGRPAARAVKAVGVGRSEGSPAPRRFVLLPHSPGRARLSVSWSSYTFQGSEAEGGSAKHSTSGVSPWAARGTGTYALAEDVFT
jgi:hypothetical protein